MQRGNLHFQAAAQIMDSHRRVAIKADAGRARGNGLAGKGEGKEGKGAKGS
jgi:hypothetical protein